MLRAFCLFLVILVSACNCRGEIELPPTIKPERYSVFLEFPVDFSSISYDGSVMIDFTALASGHEIKMHSYNLSISEVLILNNTNQQIGAKADRESDHVIKITSEEELKENEQYTLFVAFTGQVASTSHGLFRWEYQNENDKVEWQIATDFKSFKAHHAFPCFDDPKYRANFTISIQHHESYTALSNMRAGARIPQGNKMTQTTFTTTPSIPPSSLAFLVSRLANTSKTAGIEHTVAIRESQLGSTELFLAATSDTTVIVESFMKYNLTYETLHHVMLTDYESDIESFYGFNYYSAYESISADSFYETLQDSYEEYNRDAVHGNLRDTVEDFMHYESPLIVTVTVVGNNLIYIIKPNITMPMNYITSSMVNVSETIWSGHQTFESRVVDSHDWLLFNVHRLGCYRVNYDNANWMRLTRALTESREAFGDETISQLIDDSLNLARDGLLSYRIVLDLLKVMEHETSFAAWSAAVGNLLELNNRINGLDFHEHFTEFVHEISGEYVKAMGFVDPADDESMMTKFSRLQMIDLTCQTGSSECLHTMHSQLVSYLDDETLLPVNLEASIMCYGLLTPFDDADNGLRYLDKMLQKLNASSDTEYRLRIIGALGCYPEVDGLLFYLNNRTFRAGEYIHVLRSAYKRSNEGIGAVLKFLSEHSEEILMKSKDENIIETVFEEIAMKIFDEQRSEMFRDVLLIHEFSDNFKNKLCAQVTQNLEWRRGSAVDDIRAWLMGEPTTEPTEPTGTTNNTEPTEATTTAPSTTTTPAGAESLCLSLALIVVAAMLTTLKYSQ